MQTWAITYFSTATRTLLFTFSSILFRSLLIPCKKFLLFEFEIGNAAAANDFVDIFSYEPKRAALLQKNMNVLVFDLQKVLVPSTLGFQPHTYLSLLRTSGILSMEQVPLHIQYSLEKSRSASKANKQGLQF